MIRRSLIYFLILFSFPVIAYSQGVKFYGSIDAKEVVKGGYVEVSFTLENVEGSNFKPPTFKGFKKVNGPSQSSQISIVNGRRSQKISYTYTLLAEALGNQSIGAATIRVQGKSYKSKPITVRVVKGSEKLTASDDAPIFIKLEQSDSTVYKGQQTTLKYVLYTTKDINSADFRTEEAFDGFFVNRIRNFRDRAERVVIDGVQYTKKTLKTYALFPQQSGTFKFDPIPVTLGIPIKNDRSGFFFTTRVTRENITAEGGEIIVLPTPENAPVSYSGAVGKFTIQTNIDKRSITTDDAITMRMQISGNGDSKFLIAPTQPINNDWEIYDPNVISEETIERGDQVVTVKNYEYLMVPKRKGRLLVRPEFTFFDTDSATYATIYGNPAQVNVVQGTGDATLKDALKQEALAFAPIITSTKFKKKGSYFMFSPSYWVCMSLPLFGILGLFVYKRKLVQQSNIDPNLKRESEAEMIAKQRMGNAQAYMQEDKPKSFYAEVNDALYGYVSDKLFIPASELSRSNIQSKLLDHGVAPEPVTVFVALLDKVQMALYAGGGSDMKSLYNQAIESITDVDAYFK